MTIRAVINRVSDHEGLNFLLTNRIPRRTLTRFMGWFSRIEQPLVRDLSIAVWRLFTDLDLSEARETKFRSLRDCFVRQLKEGARPIDPAPEIVVSPCDAIVGASGAIADTALLQVKGFAYTLEEFVCDPELVALFRNGRYITLRLTAGMYHRFHAPHDGRVEQVTHIAGDTWNVNPPTLKRIPKVYCRNERAILRMRLADGTVVALVAVAAILVAGIRLRFAGLPSQRRHACPVRIACDARFAKGEEMGWFEHGSTIVVLAPPELSLSETVAEGSTIRMGQPLLVSSRPSVRSSACVTDEPPANSAPFQPPFERP
jgi:phosphatidylserine decarboxylase